MKVRLLSWTKDPIETLYQIWVAAIGDDDIPDVETLIDCIGQPATANFKKALSTAMPLLEMVNFVFLLEDMPVTFREQMVRHRIGIKFGDNFAVDLIQQAEGTSFWSQSFRVRDMGDFFDLGRFMTPSEIGKNDIANGVYQDTLETIQHGYRELVELGVPIEDARTLLPVACTHRMVVSVNLAALLHICKRRCCWLAQSDLWGPFVEGVSQELIQKVDERFEALRYPPCLDADGRYQNCPFARMNDERAQQLDPGIPCALFEAHCHEGSEVWATNQNLDIQKEMSIRFEKLWGFEPTAGGKS
jgi:hypothetical protein